jgi:phage tail sheath protein FI
VRVAPGSQWTLNAPTSETGHASLTIHRALIRMCAARGDMVAVLALPEHFREDEAIEHARALTPFSKALNPADLFDFPISFAEDRALSYAAIYHPWLYTRDGELVRSAPPDGAICGMIARRSIERGAWIAPANQSIPGVLALTPPLAEERWLDLLETQINIVKPSPNGFIAQAADTLSLDEDLRPLNVRRLLILLRRLLLRRGAQYVFEPFDDVFRRMVQRGLESVMESLYARGAFAGSTSAAAFQIVPRSTPLDMENGRFIMDVKVAPSLPMEFLTVRLVQSGDRSIVSEER